MGLGVGYVLEGRFEDAQRTLEVALDESVRSGCEFIADYIRPFLGTALVANGRMSDGMTMMEVGCDRIFARARSSTTGSPWC